MSRSGLSTGFSSCVVPVVSDLRPSSPVVASNR